MPIKNIGEIIDTANAGGFAIGRYRKISSNATIIGIWQDLAMSVGQPNPIYYASTPMVAAQMKFSTLQGSIFHGPNVSPMKKYLKRVALTANSASYSGHLFTLLDYLAYVPFIDESIYNEEQIIDFSAGLPRYTDGKGVKMMLVSAAQGGGGNGIYITYTNQDGVSGRVTFCTMNQGSINGACLVGTGGSASNNSASLFVPLLGADTGVRSVQSIRFDGPDVGLMTLVLVKPIASMFFNDNKSVMEKDFILHNGLIMPQIEDDAFLNMVISSRGTHAGIQLTGEFEFIYK